MTIGTGRSSLPTAGPPTDRTLRRVGNHTVILTGGGGRRLELMTIELQMLALSIVLGCLQIAIATHFKNMQYGYAWNAGPRDKPMPSLDPLAGRFARAAANFLETFPFFAAAVLMVHLADRHGTLTWWGVQLYFWGRVAYVPAYLTGIPYLRSIIWTVSIIGIACLLVALA